MVFGRTFVDSRRTVAPRLESRNPVAEIPVFLWNPDAELLLVSILGIEQVGRPEIDDLPLGGYLASQHSTSLANPQLPQTRKSDCATNFNSLRVIDCFAGCRHDYEPGRESECAQSHCEENPTDDRLKVRKERPIQEHKSVACHQCREDQVGDTPTQSQSIDTNPGWQAIPLEQPNDLPVRTDIDTVGGRHLGQAGHGHDVAAHRHHELRTGR